jgi:VRR-NUC domain
MSDRNDEARRQAAAVAWVRTVAPDVLIFAVPNGGLRSPSEAARMKWTGTVAGIPDLVIIRPGGAAHFIEMKAERGCLSKDQHVIHETLTALGTPPAICRSIDDARAAFVAWGIPTKESAR